MNYIYVYLKPDYEEPIGFIMMGGYNPSVRYINVGSAQVDREIARMLKAWGDSNGNGVDELGWAWDTADYFFKHIE